MSTGDFPDGLIQMNSEPGKLIGFTSDTFIENGEIGSQLFKKENCIYIQAIEVRERWHGHLNALLDRLWDHGFTVKVPNPLRQMEIILQKKGFEKILEQSLTSLEADLEVMYVKQTPSRS